MPDILISSPQNNRIKLVRALLAHGKQRTREKQVVLEGFRLVEDAFRQGYNPVFVLFRDGSENPLLAEFQAAGVECLPVEPPLFDALSETENTQGILAVFPLPENPLPDRADWLLALDQVRDPGNVGTILRTAAAAGVAGVISLPGTVDVFNPKTMRAGMGAHFRLPLLRLSWDTFEARYGTGWAIWRAEAHTPDAVLYDQADWRSPTILMIGGETHGISENARKFAAHAVAIPMAPGTESLNASAAAAVLLFEIRRQRQA
jgi:TrmH family RNA methyltransferase